MLSIVGIRYKAKLVCLLGKSYLSLYWPPASILITLTCYCMTRIAKLAISTKYNLMKDLVFKTTLVRLLFWQSNKHCQNSRVAFIFSLTPRIFWHFRKTLIDTICCQKFCFFLKSEKVGAILLWSIDRCATIRSRNKPTKQNSSNKINFFKLGCFWFPWGCRRIGKVQKDLSWSCCSFKTASQAL